MLQPIMGARQGAKRKGEEGVLGASSCWHLHAPYSYSAGEVLGCSDTTLLTSLSLSSCFPDPHADLSRGDVVWDTFQHRDVAALNVQHA